MHNRKEVNQISQDNLNNQNQRIEFSPKSSTVRYSDSYKKKSNAWSIDEPIIEKTSEKKR
jgi:hypothetical protein